MAFVHQIRDLKSTKSTVANQLEDFLNDGCLYRINLQVIKLPVLLTNSSIMNKFISIRMFSAAPDTITCHLRMRSFNTHRWQFIPEIA